MVSYQPLPSPSFWPFFTVPFVISSHRRSYRCIPSVPQCVSPSLSPSICVIPTFSTPPPRFLTSSLFVLSHFFLIQLSSHILTYVSFSSSLFFPLFLSSPPRRFKQRVLPLISAHRFQLIFFAHTALCYIGVPAGLIRDRKKLNKLSHATLFVLPRILSSPRLLFSLIRRAFPIFTCIFRVYQKSLRVIIKRSCETRDRSLHSV